MYAFAGRSVGFQSGSGGVLKMSFVEWFDFLQGIAVLSLRFVAPILIVKIPISFAIAYFAKKKGYGYWQFFFVSLLLESLTCFVALLLLPDSAGKVQKKECSSRP